MIECITSLKINWMLIVLAVAVLVTLWVLYRVQHSPKHIDFVDLLIDDSGKASWSKMTAIGGFVIGSWIMVYLTLASKLTEFFFLIYYAICVGSPVAFAIIGRKSLADSPQQTVTAVMPASSTVIVQPGPQP